MTAILIRGVLCNITIAKRVQQGTDKLNRLRHTEIESFCDSKCRRVHSKKCASLRQKGIIQKKELLKLPNMKDCSIAVTPWKKAPTCAALLKLPPSVCSCQALHQAWAAPSKQWLKHIPGICPKFNLTKCKSRMFLHCKCSLAASVAEYQTWFATAPPDFCHKNLQLLESACWYALSLTACCAMRCVWKAVAKH